MTGKAHAEKAMVSRNDAGVITLYLNTRGEYWDWVTVSDEVAHKVFHALADDLEIDTAYCPHCVAGSLVPEATRLGLLATRGNP